MILRAIFYKEWIKSRRVVLLLALIAVSLIAYTFVALAQVFRNNDVISAWALVIQKDAAVIPAIVRWFSFTVPLIIAVIQYAPEITDKRLKLTLHLPKPETRIVWAMMLYGVAMTSVIYAVSYSVISCGVLFYYPQEVVFLMLKGVMPMLLGGFACYFFVMWVLVEPLWRQRVANLFIAVGAVSCYLIGGHSGAFVYSTPLYIAIIAVAIALAFYSMSRFKEGAQK